MLEQQPKTTLIEQPQTIEVSPEITEALTRPTTYISIGASQVGKTTFLTKILAREDLKVGKGQTSATFQPEKYTFDNGLVSHFIDTVGIFDTAGEEKDKENEAELMSFLEKNVDPDTPVVVLLFFKKLDPFTGVAVKTAQMGKKIATRFNANILVIFTFANSKDFPGSWVEASLPKYQDREDWDETKEELFLADLWKEQKEKFVSDALEMPMSIVEVDLGVRPRAGRYRLYNGEDCMKKVADALEKVSFRSLFLMQNSKDKAAQEAAKSSISEWFKTSLRHTLTGSLAYGLLNGTVVAIELGTLVAAEGVTAGGVAAVASTGAVVGGVAGALVVALPLFMVTAVGVAGWHYWYK